MRLVKAVEPGADFTLVEVITCRHCAGVWAGRATENFMPIEYWFPHSKQCSMLKRFPFTKPKEKK